jgi:hypothetical protein
VLPTRVKEIEIGLKIMAINTSVQITVYAKLKHSNYPV